MSLILERDLRFQGRGGTLRGEEEECDEELWEGDQEKSYGWTVKSMMKIIKIKVKKDNYPSWFQFF